MNRYKFMFQHMKHNLIGRFVRLSIIPVILITVVFFYVFERRSRARDKIIDDFREEIHEVVSEVEGYRENIDYYRYLANNAFDTSFQESIKDEVTEFSRWGSSSHTIEIDFSHYSKTILDSMKYHARLDGHGDIAQALEDHWENKGYPK